MTFSAGTIGEIAEDLSRWKPTRAQCLGTYSWDNLYKRALAKILKVGGVRVMNGRKSRTVEPMEILPLLKSLQPTSSYKYMVVRRLAAINAKSPWISERDLVQLRLMSRRAA